MHDVKEAEDETEDQREDEIEDEAEGQQFTRTHTRTHTHAHTHTHTHTHTYLDIELLELVQVQPASWAVFQEAFVPLLQLMLVKLCALHQILHHLGSQLAVMLSHGSCDARTRE